MSVSMAPSDRGPVPRLDAYGDEADEADASGDNGDRYKGLWAAARCPLAALEGDKADEPGDGASVLAGKKEDCEGSRATLGQPATLAASPRPVALVQTRLE